MLERKIISAVVRYKTGEIYVGKNHAACFKSHFEAIQKRGIKYEPYENKNLFIDNNGEILNRCDAYEIAEKSGQLKDNIEGRKPYELLSFINGRPQLDSSALILTENDVKTAQNFANAMNKLLTKPIEKTNLSHGVIL